MASCGFTGGDHLISVICAQAQKSWLGTASVGKIFHRQ
jgi:hypothetical protein